MCYYPDAENLNILRTCLSCFRNDGEEKSVGIWVLLMTVANVAFWMLMKETIWLLKLDRNRGEALKASGKLRLLTGLVQKAGTSENRGKWRERPKSLEQSKPILLRAQPCGLADTLASPRWAACRVWSKVNPENRETPAWNWEGAIHKPFCFCVLKDVEKQVLWHFSLLTELTELICWVWFHCGPWRVLKTFSLCFSMSRCNFFLSLCLDTIISELQKPHSEVFMDLRVEELSLPRCQNEYLYSMIITISSGLNIFTLNWSHLYIHGSMWVGNPITSIFYFQKNSRQEGPLRPITFSGLGRIECC